MLLIWLMTLLRPMRAVEPGSFGRPCPAELGAASRAWLAAQRSRSPRRRRRHIATADLEA